MLAAAIGFADGAPHGVRHCIRVENCASFYVPRCPAHGLDQRPGRPQEPFLIRIENRYQRNLRQVQPLAQQIDADQHVEFALAQPGQQFYPLQRLDLRVHIAAAHAHFSVVAGQVFGHALGQRGHQHALVALCPVANLAPADRRSGLSPAEFRLRDRPAPSAGSPARSPLRSSASAHTVPA